MKFSVLLSVYKNEKRTPFIDSLNSVFDQTVLPNEVILVRDGELTNELEEVISDYKDKYKEIFKIIDLPKNVGLGKALNEGLKYTSFDYVARMDTDDICYPNRFEEQIKFLKANPDISVLGGIVQEFNETPKDLNQFRKLPLSHLELYNFAKYRNPLSHPSVMFKKSAVLDVGSYKDMPLFEDYYLWVRMLLKGYKIANIDEPILHFRIGNDMIGRRSGISYVKKEIKFLNSIKEIGFISQKDFLISILLKIPLRLLPNNILTFIYKKLLR